jgi:HD-GYP domain-containing protein (c-di-GMP phosphodiesterase class II)
MEAKEQPTKSPERDLESISVVPTDSTNPLFPVLERENLFSSLERAYAISASSDLNELVDGMLNLMIEVAGGDSGVIVLHDVNTDNLVFVSIAGEPLADSLNGLQIQKGEGIVGQAFGSQKDILVEDLERDPRWLHGLNPELSQRWQRALTLPLTSLAGPRGAIQIFNYRRFDLDLLRLLGRHLATEIDQLLTIEAERSSNERLRALIDVIGDMAGKLDRDDVLRNVTEHAARFFDIEKASVFLLDSDTQEVTRNVSFSVPEVDNRQESPFRKFSRFHSPTSEPPGQTRIHNATGFVADSAITVPLRAGDISLGNRHQRSDQILGGLMAWRKQSVGFTDEDAQLLEILAGQTSTFLQVAELHRDGNDLLLDIIKAMVTAIDAKDPYTQGHSLRVSELSLGIANNMGLSADLLYDLHIGSLLHDVGKIGIPDRVLMKPSKLSLDEYEIIKTHPTIGATIIGQVRLLHNALGAIEEHHERLDGSGYPRGLQGEEVSLMGRIVAVADVFDAMSTDRPYRRAYPVQEVLTYLQNRSADLFDPACVDALIEYIRIS